MKNLVLVFLVAFVSGCAFGPLVSHETARTVGDGNHELAGGYGNAGAVVKWNYGLMKNWDLGLHWESLSIGIRTKYSFLNQEKGWSLAGALGVGQSVGGSHQYADLVASYAVGSWEPYLTGRFVKVKTDPIDLRDKDTGQVDVLVESANYSYGQGILGNRYWFNPHWHLSAEGSFLFPISKVKIMSDLFFGAALGYRF